MYAKVINEQTKACEVGTGTNIAFYQSIGMAEMEVEQAYNGSWYLQGYAPEEPQEVKENEVRAIRNQYLEATDKYMIADFPLSDDEKDLYLKYRVYLRDYTRVEGWFEKNPLTFDEFCNSAKEADEEELSVVNESESEVI